MFRMIIFQKVVFAMRFCIISRRKYSSLNTSLSNLFQKRQSIIYFDFDRIPYFEPSRPGSPPPPPRGAPRGFRRSTSSAEPRALLASGEKCVQRQCSTIVNPRCLILEMPVLRLLSSIAAEKREMQVIFMPETVRDSARNQG